MNWNPCPQWGGILVRNQLECLSGMDWNRCPEWSGIPRPAKRGYLWAYVSGDGDVVYGFTTGRSREGPTAFLSGFQGTLQVDGYAGYNEIFSDSGITHAACWAHVRRKFEKSLNTHPSESAVVMQKIQKLYAVEKELREMEPKPSHEEISKIRTRDSLPVIEDLREVLMDYREEILPQSNLGKAITYAFGQWEWLGTYIHDGQVDIDNNSCERAMRRVAVGRNYVHHRIMCSPMSESMTSRGFPSSKVHIIRATPRIGAIDHPLEIV